MHTDLHTCVMTLNFGNSGKSTGGISWVTECCFFSAVIDRYIMNVLEKPFGKLSFFPSVSHFSNCLLSPITLP